uniref:Small ribosomal subunit protein uS3m n=1 Tax=Volvariella volvacea TaxID=36659 RepID=A0A5H2Q7V9_9AGAR|nr:hypothetical protein [Volvariella volvacea]AYD91361.1 hypothetical protein [Volvariella volvacea]AYD91392.1 hypothetical protein [Volvariella volvacea]AYD91446.1 hypothetical protein [Volvariella volvacea]
MKETLKQTNKLLPLFSGNALPEDQITNSIESLSLNQILELYLKGMSLYNSNLNNYLGQGQTHNRLDLILQLSPESTKSHELNVRIANFDYTLRRILPILQVKVSAALLFNVKLFCSNRLLKPEAKIRFLNRLAGVALQQTQEINAASPDLGIATHNQESQIDNRLNDIIRLAEQGTEIINELEYQITLKKNIITRIKKSRITNSINSLLPMETVNTNLETSPLVSSTPNLATASAKVAPALIENQEQKLLIARIFKSITRSNEIKIKNTINSIATQQQQQVSNTNPISIIYNQVNNKPIINNYIKGVATLSNNTLASLSLPNSLGLRRNGIFINYHNIIGYSFNNLNTKLIKNISSLLVATFKSMYCLISKPVFVITPDKIIIQLFYYLFIPNILKIKRFHRYGYRRRNNLNWIKRRRNITKLYRKLRKIKVNVRIKLRKLSNSTLIKVYPDRFKKLCEILSNLLQKPVELDLIRLHYPYNDSTILVNLLGIMINRIKLRIIIRRLFEKAVLKNLNRVNKSVSGYATNIIPAFLSGINIKVAGRLLTHKVVPRQTVKITKRGASAKGKINFSDVARFTNKNKRGAFSITITSGQNYF